MPKSSHSWWCGNESETTPCQTGIDATFPQYTSGTILGFPPIAPLPPVSTKILSNIVATTFSAGANLKAITITTSSLIKTSTEPLISTQIQGQSTRLPIDTPTPIQTQKHAASLPTAIGVGIGIPLGVFTIGFLGFLFWKEAARQRRRKPQILSQGLVLGKGDRSATAAIGAPWSELPDAQLPRELDDTGRRELPGI